MIRESKGPKVRKLMAVRLLVDAYKLRHKEPTNATQVYQWIVSYLSKNFPEDSEKLVNLARRIGYSSE
jgi:hypothetical protein